MFQILEFSSSHAIYGNSCCASHHPNHSASHGKKRAVGGAIAFQKAQNKKGEIVDTLAFSDQDEIALDYKVIQNMFGTDFYNIYSRQEVINKFLKKISL
ncbi:MAG: hypothetical protein M1571_01520 [Firmicutes bacterium]|nr:hypothetical protein [Bacillota bacterium]